MHARPVWLVRAVTLLADGLARLRRHLLPQHYAALELGTMSWIAQSVAAFCELGLPQALQDGAKTANDLASEGYGNEAMLFRLLRSLAAYDVVRYAGGGRFALGHVGKGLTGGGSLAPMLLYANAPWHTAGYMRLADAVRSGRPGFQIAQDAALFEYLKKNPQAGALFDAAMAALTPLYAPAFAAAYDFSACESVIDIGGGTGLLLSAILQRFPKLRASIFEVPEVARRARDAAAGRGDATRLSVLDGDILTDVPPPADRYILAHVLHDWDDDACASMLQNVRRAMPAHARVLVYEIVVPPLRNRWSQDRITDLEMMAMLPGRERTREEFALLFRRAGLRLTRIIATGAAESILEAVRPNRRRD